MSFRLRLIYFLVHTVQLTNKQAKQLILEKKIFINGKPVDENILLTGNEKIEVNGVAVATPVKKKLILFNKPRGYESTLSPKVKDNLSGLISNNNGLIIAGRLDKDSEGLLLLSNDGKWVEKICHPDSDKEKEYLVELDRKPETTFFDQFKKGVQLGQYLTRECFCEPLNDCLIRVILKEGKNRQIRRMCWRLGYTVVRLKRVRIDSYELDDLLPGESREMNIV